MQYPLSYIHEEVRTILDQNQEEGTILSDEANTLKLDEIIRQKILHAARHLLETSDVSVIDGKTCYIHKEGDADWPDPEPDGLIVNLWEYGNTSWGELSMWVMEMPEDYLRLLSLKMSDWKRGVHATIPYESADYSQLRSGFIGITGNPERPAVAEIKIGRDHHHISEESSVGAGETGWELENLRGLEIYTSATGDVVDFRYCAIPEYYTLTGETTEYLDFPEKLFRMLLYQTGSLVAAAYKDAGLAQLLMNMVYEGEPESKEEQ